MLTYISMLTYTHISIVNTWYLHEVGPWGDPYGSVSQTAPQDENKDLFIFVQCYPVLV